MTAYLHIDYRSPTPLHTELTMRAWIHDRVDRKIWVRGTIHDDERLTAECEGLFISMQPGKFKQLLNDRACLLYTSPSPRDRTRSRMPSSA